MNIIQYIQDHPVFALIIGGAHLATAEALAVTQVPLIVMQIFQLGAWTITSIVGLITIYGWFKKTFYKK